MGILDNKVTIITGKKVQKLLLAISTKKTAMKL